MTSIVLETKTLQNIPVLTMAPAAADHRPVIFFISGFGGGKETGLNLGYRLARRGFFFVSFDAWLHGERYDRRLDQAASPELGGIYPPETGLDTGWVFYQVIQQCLIDVQTLTEHYAADPRVDMSRCGVTGLSMGGYATFLVFASLANMQAAVPMIGVPSFTRRWLDLLDECAFSNPGWAAAIRQAEAAARERTTFIRQIDPYEKLRQAAPRALFIMNGDFDADQPKHYAIDCYRELLPHYQADPGKLKLSLYPAGHAVTPEMERDAVDWFCQHLLETPS